MSPSLSFSLGKSDVFVPDGGDAAAALARTTHLCVAAHQDDIEIMAHAGIAECYRASASFFTGVVATDGAGAPRAGRYASYTDEQMQQVRKEEQREAARIGAYNLQLQLGYPSAAVKSRQAPGRAALLADLAGIFGAMKPRVVYLHNPADKHETHVGLFACCIDALRAIPAANRPARVLGCEVWRDLDWMVDTDKVALDAGGQPELAAPLLLAFDSQISGGKRYDLATLGRRAANATFHTSHRTDQLSAITWAMDLNPLVCDPSLDVAEFTLGFVDRLRADVQARLSRVMS